MNLSECKRSAEQFRLALEASLDHAGTIVLVDAQIDHTGMKSGDLAIYEDYRGKSTGVGYNNSTPCICGYIAFERIKPKGIALVMRARRLLWLYRVRAALLRRTRSALNTE